MNKNTITICAALLALKWQDKPYYERTFAQRLPGGAGSIFTAFSTQEELEKAIKEANWVKASHPDIMPGCQGYVTNDIPGGEYGMVRIAKQPDDAKFIIADPKNTGKVSLFLKGAAERIPTDETWLIVGPGDKEAIVYTFYPGEPTPYATTSTEELAVGTELTKEEALAKGFNLAKVC